MEIIVATAIFVTVVSSILVLLNYVLQINRKVQAVRQLTQGSRNFTELISREIRNGRIDYSIADGHCSSKNYNSNNNKGLAILSPSGERSCLYLEEQTGILFIQRLTSPPSEPVAINPGGIYIEPESFRFIIRPTVSYESQNHGVQPLVTILAKFYVFKDMPDEQVIPYQTTISSDVYDIPHL